MASPRIVRLPVALTAMAIVAAVTGCATAPSGGPPRQVTGSGSQVQAYVQPLPPPPPTKTWKPTDVVLGFLHASASYAVDPAAAEQYLVPRLRKSWRPAHGAVAVVGNPQASGGIYYTKPQLQDASQQGVRYETVTLTGRQLATLSQTGHYQGTAGQTAGQAVNYEFSLVKTNGVWLIDSLPEVQSQGRLGLLLTQSDFESVYQPRNLFFYAPYDASWQDGLGVLVPDPVYAPLQSSNSALNTNLATGLVNGLLNGPGDWLSGATNSMFPPGSQLIKQVTITGHVAQVDLGGGAWRASPLQKEQMEAQLRATLADGSYSAPLATQVQLYINNVPQQSWQPTNLVTPPGIGPVLVVTGLGSVGELPAIPRPTKAPSPRVGPAQVGRSAITAVAGQPGRAHTPPMAVAVQYGAGCAVLESVAGQTSYHSYVLSTSGGACTSLSWDNSGNVWAGAGQAIWVLPPQSRRPIAVDVANLTALAQHGSQILGLRIAPDSVRAALLVRTRSQKNLLLLAAAQIHRDHNGQPDAVAFGQPVSIGASLTDPMAMSWLNAYHLAVLNGGQDGSVIYDLPLTGGAGIQPGGSPLELSAAPNGAQTLTTDGSELVVGATDSGVSRIFASSLSAGGWVQVATGSDPVYPG